MSREGGVPGLRAAQARICAEQADAPIAEGAGIAAILATENGDAVAAEADSS
jgi:dihydroxyacetone kinase DhaKLM complex PTS-EIIA-like component DhaM